MIFLSTGIISGKDHIFVHGRNCILSSFQKYRMDRLLGRFPIFSRGYSPLYIMLREMAPLNGGISPLAVQWGPFHGGSFTGAVPQGGHSTWAVPSGYALIDLQIATQRQLYSMFRIQKPKKYDCIQLSTSKSQ